MIMPTQQELIDRFCNGCPTLGTEKGCPCPNGQKDYYKCNWKAVFQEAGTWGTQAA